MQGQKGTIGSLPESLGLEHGSTSNDSTVVDQQICWTNFMRHPPIGATNHENQNLTMWSMGESSSSSVPNQASASQNRIDPKTEHGWSSLMRARNEPPQHEPPTSMLSLGNGSMNITHNPNPNPNQYHNHATNAHNITVSPSTLIGSSDRQLPLKRKATELTIGQSSSGLPEGSTSTWRSVSGLPEGSSSAWRSVSENPPTVNPIPSDPIMPRLGLGVGVGGVSSSENRAESSRRNVRIRINNSRQHDQFPVGNVSNGQLNFSSPYPSLGLNPVDLRPPTVANSSSQDGQPVLWVPALRRNLQVSSRTSRSSSRTSRTSNIISGSGDNSRTIPTNISDHPLFVQPRDIRNTPQTGINSVPAVPPSLPPNVGPSRGSAHYPSRRLHEILRRSLLPSVDSGAGGSGVGGQTGNLFARLPPPVGPTSQEDGIPPVIGVPGHHHHHRHHLVAHQRSSDRQLDGAYGFPFLARAAGSEGRGRLVSEIRNVLDLIRRGEGLRFEDVMLLDQSMFYGMAEIHDRHRDMRLDIDNMSYEELLALEERIGNVNTGLTEENISSCLKQKTYTTVADQPEAEPCCICQEEYKNGDDLGGLKCGHDFHSSCIKQWLLQKNLCPVCKSAAAATTK